MELRDVTELIVDSEHKTAPKQDTGYPYIRTPNIGKGRLILDDVQRISEKSYKEWTRRAVPQKNDLILAREAPVGNVAIVTDGIKPCLGQRTVLIRPDLQKINPEYLVYLMLGDEIQERFYAVSTGATVPHLNMSDIRGLELPELPSLETQHKIASTLSAFDDLIKNDTRRIEILEQMARRIYREWFVHFRYPGHEDDELVGSGTELGEIPEGWEVNKLDEIIELTYGIGLRKKDRVEGRYPVYGSSGIIDWHNDYHVEGPGVIVGRKGNVGSMFWEYENFNPIDTTYYVETELPLTYAYYNLQNQNFINSDAAVPGLSKRQANTLPVLVPDKEILENFDNNILRLFNLKRVLNEKNEKLKKTRELLLPKLISGKVDVEKITVN